jgi:hypothetical protein
MTNLAVQINGQQVSGSLQDVAQILGLVTDTISEHNPNKKDNTFDEFLLQTITPHFGEEMSQEILNCLDEIRRTEPDYRKFRKFYHKVATIENRQLLKTVSAVYRIKYCRFLKETYLSSLFSVIKYATACPHCGRFAHAFILRLHQEGLLT